MTPKLQHKPPLLLSWKDEKGGRHEVRVDTAEFSEDGAVLGFVNGREVVCVCNGEYEGRPKLVFVRSSVGFPIKEWVSVRSKGPSKKSSTSLSLTIPASMIRELGLDLDKGVQARRTKKDGGMFLEFREYKN